MSRSLLIKGTFRNGRTRQVGIFNPTNCEYDNSKFTEDDVALLTYLVNEDKGINDNLALGKFIRLEIFFNGSYGNPELNNKGYLPLVVADEHYISNKFIAELVNEANTY